MRESWLVWRILRGDKRAGEELVAVNYPRIFRLLRYLTGRADIAEDLTQQTFVRAWQALPNFRHQSSLATWLHRIAYHEYTHWLRDRREHASLDSASHLAAPSASHEWETLVLPHALAQLSQEHREAFLLFHIQELSIGEIAAILEVPGGTVKSRLFTARQRLREILEAEAASVELTAPAPSMAATIAPKPQKEILHELSTH
ncbi:MAG: polymerase sigma-70 factor, subfamily [Chthonomonadaceae bacterium]|nr:polymerase sigma-70 factor, subfamily [Chthonomonadaceae bacterium]